MDYQAILQAVRAGIQPASAEIDRARAEAGVSVHQLIGDLAEAFSHRELCPVCGKVTGTRTSKPVENRTKRRRYFDCTCGMKWSRDCEIDK